MCNVSDDLKPEQKLAELVNRELDTKIDAVALRLFVRQNWARITGLAHAIHDGSGLEKAAAVTAPGGGMGRRP
ncbi:hypothetical protein OIU35_31640 [Boseaceae bacterium BT-24-1]|nr:hypothetical protein [Boseaceae bacterium BT-24-1]